MPTVGETMQWIGTSPMPKRRTANTLVDQAIDERLERLALMRFGEPQETRIIPKHHIFNNPVQRFPLVDATGELVALLSEQEVAPTFWVRPHHEKARRYELLYGPHHLLAVSLAGVYQVPCVIVDVDDATLNEFGLIEAMQRMS